MKVPRRLKDEGGQVLAIVIAILVIISTLVPLMVMYTQREAAWTAKQASNTTAFHMAEAGIEKAYLEISLSTLTWVNLQNGTSPLGYRFDVPYSDISGGSYAISITSGPLKQQATVISVGRDRFHRETRSIQAIYGNMTAGNMAILGGTGVDVSGNNFHVEWGAIMSPQTITPNGDNHPTYWSASAITGLDTNGTTPPNCDSPNCWWWHSYYAGIPPFPAIDFNFYKSSAQAANTSGCGLKYYTCSTCTAPSSGCSDLTGKAFYDEKDWSSFDGPIIGTVIVMGNLTTGNGSMSGHTVNAAIPQTAWKEYCNDWAYYMSNFNSDAGLTASNPAACPGLYSSYTSPANMTASISPVVNGLLYVGGDFTGPNGGGNSVLEYGVIVVKGMVNLNGNSHVSVYYGADAGAGLQTTQIILSRVSWKDSLYQWPNGL